MTRKAAPARKSSLKSKQRAVSADEKVLWDRLAGLGCIACLLDGNLNQHVSIHHVDGRTKPGCHKMVLALCAPHHQHDDTDPACRIGVHPWSGRFETKYGNQVDLVAYCMVLLEIGP